MALLAADVSPHILNPIPIVWNCRRDSEDLLVNIKGTGTVYHNNHFSAMWSTNGDINNMSTNHHDSNLFIDHMNKFEKYYEEFGNDLAINYEHTKTTLEYLLSELLDLNLDGLSSELTYDSTLFFILKKGDFTLYIEQFFDESNELKSDPELVLTVFEKKQLFYNSTGSLTSLFSELEQKAQDDKKSVGIRSEFLLNELSY